MHYADTLIVTGFNVSRNAIKAQVLVDFLAETKEEDFQNHKDKTKNKGWRLCIDGASSDDGSEAGLMIVSPEALRIAKEMKIEEITVLVDSQLVTNLALSVRHPTYHETPPDQHIRSRIPDYGKISTRSNSCSKETQKVLVDFLAETKEEDFQNHKDKTKNKGWRLCIDGASSDDGSEAGLMIVSPEALRIAKEMKIEEITVLVDSQLVAN
nr:hypothetical protein [Tanacetum cinerariifolium]